MVLNRAVNDVRVCLVPGCEALVVLMSSDGDPATRIDDFMTGHDCDCNRFPPS